MNNNRNMQSQSEANVSIEGMAFNPAEIVISPGTKVNWINQDTTTHTVTSDEESEETGFDSGTLDIDEMFSHVFEETGEFEYHCSIHPTMKGKIIVS